MYKDLIEKSTKSTISSVLAVEKKIGSKFPNEFVDFALKNNGAYLENAGIKAQFSKLEQNLYGVSRFFTIEEIGSTKIECWDNLNIAFAEDSCGNFFVLRKSDMQSVHFWDHETNSIELVAKSFGDFLTSIISIDIEEIPEALNARGWIDPDFLADLKKRGEI